MQTAILVLHVIVCIFLVVLVLLQAGREGMGVIFGGSNDSTVFGSSGAGGILAKLTAFLAVLFVATSLGYNLMNSSGKPTASSILDVQIEEVAPQAVPAPAVEPKAADPAPAPKEPAAEPKAPAAQDPAAAPKASETAEPEKKAE
ncbi:MAG: preprotein translocase subunit SecG [Mailhella sp.]|nr:preprotein translocase subunit SecG [Mailhella sp.]